MRYLLMIVVVLMITGCNTGVAFSLLGDLVQLRIEREVSGEGHVEDMFKDAKN